MDAHRVRGRTTSVSWIPEGSVTGLVRSTFDRGITRYDRPPDDHLSGLEQLHRGAAEDRFRFATTSRCAPT